MKELAFDSGIEEFAVAGGGVLRFNPADPNVYARFLEAAEEMKSVELELVRKAQALENAPGAQPVLALMGEADSRLKALLDGVFPGNDFHKALGGVNLLAMAANGQRVAVNLFEALEQLLTAGAERFADAQVARLRAQQ